MTILKATEKVITLTNPTLVGATLSGGTLVLAQGTSSLASLRFAAAGTDLTTPVAGTIEYDGTNVKITNSANNRKTFLFSDSSGTNLTNLTASNIVGTIPSTVLGNSTVYIGTTAIALNRTSAGQLLTGINIDGTAYNITQFTINQSVGTSNNVQFNSIGVNTAASGTAGEIKATQAWITGGLGVGTSPSATAGEIRATNDITAYYSSDERLKENIVTIDNAVQTLFNLRGVRFDWKDEYIKSRGGEDGYFVRKNDIGLIAQEVEAVLPELVGTREDGTKAVKYDRLVAVLIEAIKSQQIQIDFLLRKIV